MARALVIEEESGTYCGRIHPHNGYYAGDFSTKNHSVVQPGAAAPRHLRGLAARHVDATTADIGAARREAA
jgi:hypothetical protein